jgi:hypothetical protein
MKYFLLLFIFSFPIQLIAHQAESEDYIEVKEYYELLYVGNGPYKKFIDHVHISDIKLIQKDVGTTLKKYSEQLKTSNHDEETIKDLFIAGLKIIKYWLLIRQ